MTNSLEDRLHHATRFDPHEVAEEIDRLIEEEVKFHGIGGHREEWEEVLRLIRLKLDSIERKL